MGDNGAVGAHRNGYNGLYSVRALGGGESPFVKSTRAWTWSSTSMPGRARRIRGFSSSLAGRRCASHDWGTPPLNSISRPRPCRCGESHSLHLHPAPLHRHGLHLPRTQADAGRFLGCFWASCIKLAEDKSIYFLAPGSSIDSPTWVQFCTQQHGRDSTVAGAREAMPAALELGRRRCSAASRRCATANRFSTVGWATRC